MNITLLALSAIFFLMVVIGSVIVFFMPRFQTVTLGQADRKAQRVILLAAVLVILSCITPMGLSPIYNGSVESQRNQYEMITEAFLAGQLHFQYEVDERLLALENPYNMVEDGVEGIDYHWDHAFYNGHYYMYFGVVPVLLLFLPFRVITGQPLTGYHGTQVFAAIYIIGLFMVFKLLGQKFFKKMSLSVYLLLSAAVIYLSIWHAVAAPALYCMSILSALAFAVWSIYFFLKAVFCCEKENKAIACAALGSLLGALEFGCRPTVGMSNLVVVPLILIFVQKRGISARLLGKMALAALPYAIVAAGLMGYNYARFGNPFEFGQSYQLTVVDQSGYAESMLARFDLMSTIRDMYFYMFNNLLSLHDLEPLPRIGLFITFPLLPVSFLLALLPKTFRHICKNRLTLFAFFLLVSTAVIIVFDVLWAPFPEPRYRMDFAWLLGVAAFIFAGSYAQETGHRKVFHGIIGAVCILTIVAGALLFLYPGDYNFTHYFGINLFGD